MRYIHIYNILYIYMYTYTYIHTYILYVMEYIHFRVFRFLFFFVSSHIGNQPQEELTKFGYRSERKVEKFKNPAIFWRPADGTY
jgi:hypothetical protein